MHQVRVIAQLEVEIRLFREFVVLDAFYAIGWSERRHCAEYTVIEHALYFLAACQADWSLQLPFQLSQVEMTIGTCHRKHIFSIGIQQHTLRNPLRRNLRRHGGIETVAGGLVRHHFVRHVMSIQEVLYDCYMSHDSPPAWFLETAHAAV
jgi:hypothetical protein